MSKPENFIITTVTEDHETYLIDMSWSPVENAIGYRVYRSQTNDYSGVNILNRTEQTQHSLPMTVYELTEHYYYVVPLYANREGDPSDIIHVTLRVSVKDPLLRIYYGLRNGTMRTFQGGWGSRESRLATRNKGITSIAEIDMEARARRSSSDPNDEFTFYPLMSAQQDIELFVDSQDRQIDLIPNAAWKDVDNLIDQDLSTHAVLCNDGVQSSLYIKLNGLVEGDDTLVDHDWTVDMITISATSINQLSTIPHDLQFAIVDETKSGVLFTTKSSDRTSFHLPVKKDQIITPQQSTTHIINVPDVMTFDELSAGYLKIWASVDDVQTPTETSTPTTNTPASDDLCSITISYMLRQSGTTYTQETKTIEVDRDAVSTSAVDFFAGKILNDSNGDLYKPKNNNRAGNFITLTVDSERNLTGLRLTNSHGSWGAYTIPEGTPQYVSEFDLNIYPFYKAASASSERGTANAGAKIKTTYNGAQTKIYTHSGYSTLFAYWAENGKPYVKDAKIVSTDLDLDITKLTTNAVGGDVEVTATVEIPPSSCDITPQDRTDMASGPKGTINTFHWRVISNKFIQIEWDDHVYDMFEHPNAAVFQGPVTMSDGSKYVRGDLISSQGLHSFYKVELSNLTVGMVCETFEDSRVGFHNHASAAFSSNTIYGIYHPDDREDILRSWETFLQRPDPTRPDQYLQNIHLVPLNENDTGREISWVPNTSSNDAPPGFSFEYRTSGGVTRPCLIPAPNLVRQFDRNSSEGFARNHFTVKAVPQLCDIIENA